MTENTKQKRLINFLVCFIRIEVQLFIFRFIKIVENLMKETNIIKYGVSTFLYLFPYNTEKYEFIKDITRGSGKIKIFK